MFNQIITKGIPTADGTRRTTYFLYGSQGVVQFAYVESDHWDALSMGIDVGFHSPRPMYDGHRVMDDHCPHLEGPCYYDGSSLMAEELYHRFLWANRNDDIVWDYLEKYYWDVFGNIVMPKSGDVIEAMIEVAKGDA